MNVKETEWCGLPTPLEGERLILAPGHLAEQVYREIDEKHLPELLPIDRDSTVVNTWFCRQRNLNVLIWRDPDKSLKWGYLPVHQVDKQLHTMGCSYAWSMDAECKALAKLQDLLPSHLFKMYFLTGMFLETSARSGVTYIFRKLRPTIALRATDGDETKYLTSLCLHPIGWYEDTWAGCLTPTDDVIAHLLLMRADEPYLWRKANHIPLHRPAAGL